MQPRRRIHRHEPCLNADEVLLSGLIERVFDFDDLTLPYFSSCAWSRCPIGVGL